ncbi:MAG: hypothetical protein AB2L09_00470 [Coriobacteriia bacterium]
MDYSLPLAMDIKRQHPPDKALRDILLQYNWQGKGAKFVYFVWNGRSGLPCGARQASSIDGHLHNALLDGTDVWLEFIGVAGKIFELEPVTEQ